MAGKKSDGQTIKAEIKAEIKKELSAQDLKDLRDLQKLGCSLKKGIACNGSGGCVYFLAFLGAAFYYIGTAPTFWDAVIGFLKALVWPAFLVFEVLSFIGMQ